MNEEIKKANEDIIADNERTDKLCEGINNSFNQINENFNRLKTSLTERMKEIKNPNANNLFLKIQKDIIDMQIELNKALDKVKKEREHPRSKIYELLYPEEEPISPQEGGKKQEKEAKNAL